ncbi:hypothetical protein MIR68_002133 [Amoeboaphelidium protococcarum]|nr:hypothetical protein MIR68_002133 [Amoeboaphelidium protococcarum]
MIDKALLFQREAWLPFDGVILEFLLYRSRDSQQLFDNKPLKQESKSHIWIQHQKRSGSEQRGGYGGSVKKYKNRAGKSIEESIELGEQQKMRSRVHKLVANSASTTRSGLSYKSTNSYQSHHRFWMKFCAQDNVRVDPKEISDQAPEIICLFLRQRCASKAEGGEGLTYGTANASSIALQRWKFQIQSSHCIDCLCSGIQPSSDYQENECRGFLPQVLDAIAKRLAEFYDFSYRFTSGATIRDVLEAKDGVEGEDWDIRKARKTLNQVDDDGFVDLIRKGQPLTQKKLPDVYTADEWGKISRGPHTDNQAMVCCQVQQKTSAHIHSGTLPSTSNGKAYIIIPHSEFTEEMIQFLKSIGVKASLFSSPDDLEVKDENFLSDSSFTVC